MADEIYRIDFKTCSEFIQRYDLDAWQYPKMIWSLEVAWMNYVIRSYPEEIVELKFMHNPKYMSYFITKLIFKNRLLAESLLMKYNLYNSDAFRRPDMKEKVSIAY
jgi:hypothetical protein